MAPTNPPTREVGHSGGYVPDYNTRDPRNPTYRVASGPDVAPELQFPDSIVVYDAMTNETHITAILEAMIEPLTSANWHLDGTGVPDNVTETCRIELGLATEDTPLQRAPHRGVNIREHIAEMAYTMVWAGFACAQTVYASGPPLPDEEGLGAGYDGNMIHLRKLASRPPRTITKIEVANDGGLKGIYQTPLTYATGRAGEDTFIPVDQLVFYSHKRRGGDWAGRSVLRPAYRPWIMKDMYLRLDARAVEKHSSGHWRGTAADPNRRNALFQELAMMQDGSRSVIVTDPQDTVEFIGVSGNLVDITPRLAYLDQEMSRSALAMFLDLGHDNGARSLGETFYRIFFSKVKALAEYIGQTITDHVIRDLVRWNFPEGTPYPILTPGDLNTQQGTAADVIATLMNAGAITYDADLEKHVRQTIGLPYTEPDEDAEPDDGTDGMDDLDRALKLAQIRSTNTVAAGAAFRNGYVPETLQAAYDLPDVLQHTGFFPTTVKSENVVEAEDAAAAAEVSNIPEADAPETATPETPTPGTNAEAVTRAASAYRALLRSLNA